MKIEVAAADRAYQVVIEDDLHASLSEIFSSRSRIALVIPESLYSGVLSSFVAPLVEREGTLLILTPDGEAQKSIDILSQAWNLLGEAGFTRNDVIIGVGGGATTDLAGYLAASWLRGVEWFAIPTSLAGMVDASVGGKTGINTPVGKNLVGAFHSPTAVLISPRFLESLPSADISAGLAEVVKCGFIADPVILDLISNAGVGTLTNGSLLGELITRSVRVKAEVVSKDFKESGLREILNYGHTLGHAIEKQERYLLRHGEAVSIGMVFAAELAQLAGLVSREIVDSHRTILQTLGLPIRYSGLWPEIRQAMAVDKKSRGNQLRFVVLDALGSTTRLEGPDEALLYEAYGRLQS